MTKKEVIRQVSEALEISLKDATTFVDTFINVVQTGVKEHGKVQITDFLTVEGRAVEARPGRNPQTGEEIQIAARTQLYAKFGTGFKNFVNNAKAAPAAKAPAKKAPAKKAAPAAKAPAKKAPAKKAPAKKK